MCPSSMSRLEDNTHTRGRSHHAFLIILRASAAWRAGKTKRVKDALELMSLVQGLQG